MTNGSFTERFLPDTGTTLTYVPEDIFYGILDFFPDAEPVPSYGYVVDCAHLEDLGTIDFTFGDFTIHVPYSDFIFQLAPEISDGEGTVCILGAVPASSFFILGDTFLRAAYGKTSTVPGCKVNNDKANGA